MRAARICKKAPRRAAPDEQDAKAALYSSARSLPVSRPGRCGGAALRGLRPMPPLDRRVGAATAGRRSLSLASACPAVSASSTSAPIAAGTAGAATARSAVARPVSNANRVSNNRKNRPCYRWSIRYYAPFPEHRVKAGLRLGGGYGPELPGARYNSGFGVGIRPHVFVTPDSMRSPCGLEQRLTEMAAGSRIKSGMTKVGVRAQSKPAVSPNPGSTPSPRSKSSSAS